MISFQSIKKSAESLKRITGILSKRLSLITLWLIFTGVCIYNIQNKDWNKPIRLVKDDVQNYYIYTVAVIVYQDIKLDRVYAKLPREVTSNFWLGYHKETRKAYSKMSMGLALVYAPFTAFAHYVLVPLMGAEPNGYSPPYKIGLLISALAFFLFGLWKLRKLLLEHFSETVTALTLIVIAFGTNITWYVSSEATMSHIYSFTLIIYMYRLLQQWFIKPGIWLTILIGLVFGLIVLIRPTNLMFLVLFFATDNFRERLMFLLSNYARIILMILMFLLVWSPQFAFWKYVSGEWFFYTYDKETFFWNNPQIFSSLFSYRKGWLIYTPLMVLAFIGLPLLWKKYRPLFWQVSTVLVLLIYINSSWWCWWFGGSYGNRAYIDGYGLFALAIAAVMQAFAGFRKKILNYSGIIIIALFTCLNLFQTWQCRMGLIHYIANTKETYRMNFLKTQPHPDFYNSLIMPDHEMAMAGRYYPKTEMKDVDLNKFKFLILNNQQYLLRYYKVKINAEGVLQKYAAKHNLSQVTDSICDDWALDRYNNLRRRY